MTRKNNKEIKIGKRDKNPYTPTNLKVKKMSLIDLNKMLGLPTMENPIKDNRIVSDKTFARRLKSHLKGMRASCSAGEEEIEYLQMVADKLLKYQIETCPEEERWYHENCDNSNRSSYKDKLKALLEGLETQNVEKLIREGAIGDYRNYGKAYINAVRDKVKDALK